LFFKVLKTSISRVSRESAPEDTTGLEGDKTLFPVRLIRVLKCRNLKAEQEGGRWSAIREINC
jgi:hypothetical protein